jgi:hypothetical protein
LRKAGGVLGVIESKIIISKEQTQCKSVSRSKKYYNNSSSLHILCNNNAINEERCVFKIAFIDHVILFRPSYYGMVIRLSVKTPGLAVGLTRIHKLENTMAANKGSLSDGATTPHCTHPSKLGLVIELRVIDITFKPKDIMGRVYPRFQG